MNTFDLTTFSDAELARYHARTLRDARVATLACRHYEREARRLNDRELMIRAEFDRRQQAEFPEGATDENAA